MEPIECIRAYLAGLVDGEGCITISKQIRKNRISPAYRSMITVSNTDKRLVEIFKKYYGGSVAKRPESRVEKNWADSWTWYCVCSSVEKFLTDILPFLVAKNMQAELVRNFQRIKTSYKVKTFGQGLGSLPLSEKEVEIREKFWKAVRLLNTKGKYSRTVKQQLHEKEQQIKKQFAAV